MEAAPDVNSEWESEEESEEDTEGAPPANLRPGEPLTAHVDRLLALLERGEPSGGLVCSVLLANKKTLVLLGIRLAVILAMLFSWRDVQSETLCIEPPGPDGLG